VNKTFLFILFSLIFLPVTSTVARTLHAIVVANTDISDIGKSCEIDQIAITVELNSIALAIGYELKLTTINRGSFNFEQLELTIKSFTCDTSDIVFFFFAGHGYNDKKQDSKWPVLHLQDGGYPLDLLHEQLKAKNPRLLISIADCCNTVFDPLNAENRGFKIVPANDTIDKVKVYKNLFLWFKGDVLASGCEKGQCSYSTNKDGGIFTHKFIISLQAALNYGRLVSWTDLLEDTKSRVMQLNVAEKQVPQYQVNSNNNSNNIITPVPTISYAEINKYFRELTDKSLQNKRKTEMLKKWEQYFIKNARVDIYVNTTLTDVNTVEDYLTRLDVNKSQIKTINIIETKSEIDGIDKKYTRIAVQEIWNN
jgi:hypothetical protein